MARKHKADPLIVPIEADSIPVQSLVSPRHTLSGHSYGSIVAGYAQRKGELTVVNLHNGYTIRLPIPKGYSGTAIKDGAPVLLQLKFVPPASRKKAKKRAPKFDAVKLVGLCLEDPSYAAAEDHGFRYKRDSTRDVTPHSWEWVTANYGTPTYSGVGQVLEISELPGSGSKSEPIRLANVRLPDGTETKARIPHGVNHIAVGSWTWVRSDRAPKAPNVSRRVAGRFAPYTWHRWTTWSDQPWSGHAQQAALRQAYEHSAHDKGTTTRKPD